MAPFPNILMVKNVIATPVKNGKKFFKKCYAKNLNVQYIIILYYGIKDSDYITFTAYCVPANSYINC